MWLNPSGTIIYQYRNYMNTKFFFIALLLAIFMPAPTLQAAATLKIGGQTVTSTNPIEGVTVSSNSERTTLTLTNCHVKGSAVGIEYSYSQDGVSGPAALSLLIIVNGICTVESTAGYGFSSNQEVLVMGGGSLYVKGTVGVNLIGAATGAMMVADGVELTCEGTNGAGIKGLTYQKTKVTVGYYKSLAVRGSATSLIAKGVGKAIEDISDLILYDGAAVKHPSDIEFADHALVTTDWVHITATGLPIDAERFPDATLRGIVTSRYDIHADGYLSRYERSQVTVMDVAHTISAQPEIFDMTGVNYFTNLTSLNINLNHLTTPLDIRALTKLENLECYACLLTTTIDLSHCPQLKTLDVCSNNFTELDLSANTKLTSLKANRSYIKNLDVSTCPDLEVLEYQDDNLRSPLESVNVTGCTKLTRLLCKNSRLTALDVSSCTALQYLNCSDASITSLNVSNCKELIQIACNKNSISGELDLTGFSKLHYLYCQDNSLTSLKLGGCTSLDILFCENNRLTALDIDPDNTQLSRLTCSGNALTALDVSGKELKVLRCEYCTSLKTLDISNNKLYDDGTYFVGGAFSIAGCTALEEIRCQQNTFSGEELDKLIADLPTAATQPAPLYLVSDADGEQNACTAGQALAIFLKGWLPLRLVDGEWQLIPFERDVNGDGLFDSADAVEVVNHLLGQPTSDDFNSRLADADGDGRISIADVATIVSALLPAATE